jgi:uncharacterized phage-associated protein
MFRAQNDKRIGHILIYLAKQGAPLYLTKALKLLFMLDEESIIETGAPITWLDYQAWEQGPVANEIYDEIYGNVMSSSSKLGDYISWYEKNGNTFIEAKADFDSDEFTDYEITLMEEFASSYCFNSSTELVDEVHRPGTPWQRVVEERGLQAQFDAGKSRSNERIHLQNLIDSDEYKSEVYKNARESQHLQGL